VSIFFRYCHVKLVVATTMQLTLATSLPCGAATSSVLLRPHAPAPTPLLFPSLHVAIAPRQGRAPRRTLQPSPTRSPKVLWPLFAGGFLCGVASLFVAAVATGCRRLGHRWRTAAVVGVAEAKSADAAPRRARRGRPRKSDPAAGVSPGAVAVRELLSAYHISNIDELLIRHPGLQGTAPDSIRATLDFLADHGVDVPKAVARAPLLLLHPVEQLREAAESIQPAGLTLGDVVRRSSGLLLAPTASVHASTTALQSYGIDATVVVRRAPNALALTSDALGRKLTYLAALGIDVPRAVHRAPTVLTQSVDGLDAKVAWLYETCGDAVRVINRQPAMLCLGLDALQARAEYLAELGLEPGRTIAMYPAVLLAAPASLRDRAAYFQRLGIDFPRVASAFPPVFGLSLTANVAPKIAFLMEEMRLPVQSLHACPQYLGYSLARRLRPRFLFLRHTGRPMGSLSTLVTTSDAAFARTVAGSTLEDYARWRSNPP